MFCRWVERNGSQSRRAFEASIKKCSVTRVTRGNVWLKGCSWVDSYGDSGAFVFFISTPESPTPGHTQKHTTSCQFSFSNSLSNVHPTRWPSHTHRNHDWNLVTLGDTESHLWLRTTLAKHYCGLTRPGQWSSGRNSLIISQQKGSQDYFETHIVSMSVRGGGKNFSIASRSGR